ncbi:MAG: methyltransferase domain-containing protein, partial [Verrucomicrobia bacterium]|nr:methyltransferase domain-containing protein [Verrucomicrobiota bacterium]
ACISKGLSVRQGNIEEGLRDYPEGEFDYVILSQTIGYLDNPQAVVKEMLRVGKRAIISFENAGYWENRIKAMKGKGMGHTLLSGEPRCRLITLSQFEQFVKSIDAQIERREFLQNGKHIASPEMLDHLVEEYRYLGVEKEEGPALLADTAMYVLKIKNS